MKALLFLLLLGLGAIAQPHERASEVKVKVYRFAVSKSPLCTDPIVVFSNDKPKEVELYDSPDLGTGNLADGSYPCAMVEMSDLVKFVPASREGICHQGVEYSYDVCGAKVPFRSLEGKLDHCTKGEEKVTVYFSIASKTDRASLMPAVNPYLPPSKIEGDKERGMLLAQPLLVSGETSAGFLFNPNLQITDFNGTCILEIAQFAFRQ